MKLLLIASTGGHLAQLVRFAPLLGAHDDSLWVTFENAQSRALLEGKRVLFVPYVKSRDLKATVVAYNKIRRVIRGEKFELAVSTGAALAVAGLMAARRSGIPVKYIESVSRVYGPSLSGRLLHALGVRDLYTQHATWANETWTAHPTVLEAYASRISADPIHRPRIFVTLGTIRGYRFDALVDAVLNSGLANEETVWQLGETTRRGLPGVTHEAMSSAEFRAAALNADVVISHSGVGSLLGLLEDGIRPILVVRRKARREHVDDHQEQIARLASARGVAWGLEVGELTADAIRGASQWEVYSA